MEVVVRENNDEVNSMPFSGSSPSAVELRSCDIVAAVDDKQLPEQCDHFSIRGYGTQVRKEDPKSCSLFQMFTDQQSGKHANSLPPLSVPKFRQWNCKNCVDKMKISENTAAVRNISAKMDADNNCCTISFIQSTPVPINVGCKKLFPFFQLSSEEENVGRLSYLESATKESNCLSKEEINGANMVPAMKDSQVSIINHDGTKNLSANASVAPAAKELQVPLPNHDGTKYLSSNASIGAMPVPEACQMANKEERNGTQIPYNPKYSEEILKPYTDRDEETQETMIVDLNTSNIFKPASRAEDDQLVDEGLHEHDTLERSTGANNCEAKYDKSTSQMGISNVKVHHKKSRKVRLLSDILNSDAAHMPGKDLESGHYKVANVTEDSSSRMSYASQGSDGVDNHPTAEKFKVKPVESKKNPKAPDGEDDESSLMNWLKKTQKKLKAENRGPQQKHGSALDANSKSATDTSVAKVADPNSTQFEADKCKEQATVSSIQSAAPDVHSVSQNGSLDDRITAVKSQHDGESIHNHFPKKKINKKGSLHQTGSEKCTQRHLSQVSLGKHDLQKATGLPRQKILKKQRPESMHEMEALEDIPMDIVELLAKNQQERQQTNDKHASDITDTQSKMTGFTKGDHTSAATEDPQNKVSIGMDTNFSQKKSSMFEKKQKSSPGNVETSVKTATAGPLNSDHRHYASMQDRQPTKEDPASVATSFQTSLHRNDDHSAGAKAQNCSRKGMRMTIWEKYEAALREDSLALQCSGDFRPNNHYVDSDFSFMKPVSVNFVAQQTEAAMSPSRGQAFPTVLSTTGAGNVCRVKVSEPPGLYANETMPATHLLRMMDSSQQTGVSSYENQAELFQNPTFYSAYDQYKRSTSTSPGAECYEQSWHQYNSCKPLRPLPRVGVLGSLLQKEITNWSENCGTQSGYRIGESNGLTSFDMSRKPGLQDFSSGISSAKGNAQNHYYSYENTSQRFGSVSSVAPPGLSSAREGVAQGRMEDGERTAQPSEKSRKQDVCVMNRNPAEFTTIAEDNEYMFNI